MPNNQRSTRAANTYRRRRIGAGFTISGLLLMILSFVTGGTAAAKSQPATSGDDKCYAQVDEYRYTREVPVMRTDYQYQKQTREHSRESVESEWGPWTDWAWWSPPSYKWSPTQVEVFEGPAAHAGDPNGTWYREYRYVPNGQTREVQTGTTTEDSGWVTSQPAGDGWTQVDHRVVNGEVIPCPTTTTTTTAPQPKGSLSLSCADNGTVALSITLEQESTVSNVSDGVILVGDDGSDTLVAGVTLPAGTYTGRYEGTASSVVVQFSNGLSLSRDVPNCTQPTPGGTAVAECDNVKVTNTGDVTLDLEVGGVPAGTIAPGGVKNLGDVYDTTGGIEIALLYQGNPVYSDVLQEPDNCEQPVINSVKILLNKDCDGNVVSGKIVVDGSHPLDAISISGAIPDVPEGVNELVLSGDGLAAAAAAQAGSGATWEIGGGEIHGTVDFVVNEPEPGSCVKKIAIPAQPSVTDPCGANNATWNVPADTAQLDWTLRADGHLVVQTQPGFIFTDGTTEKDFGVAPDSGEACPPGKVGIPAQPSVTDPCGANNATWNVPADTAQLDWTLRADGHLVVQTQPGFIFTDGTTEKDFGVAPDSGEACPPTTTPGTNPPPPTTVAPTTTISPQLPATGGSSTSLLSLIGMILVLVGGALLVGSNGRRPYGLS